MRERPRRARLPRRRDAGRDGADREPRRTCPPSGAIVARVVPDSPAEEAGLQGGDQNVVVDGESYVLGGDVVTQADGKPVASADDLRSLIGVDRSPGDSLELEIRRGDETHDRHGHARRRSRPARAALGSPTLAPVIAHAFGARPAADARSRGGALRRRSRHAPAGRAPPEELFDGTRLQGRAPPGGRRAEHRHLRDAGRGCRSSCAELRAEARSRAPTAPGLAVAATATWPTALAAEQEITPEPGLPRVRGVRRLDGAAAGVLRPARPRRRRRAPQSVHGRARVRPSLAAGAARRLGQLAVVRGARDRARLDARRAAHAAPARGRAAGLRVVRGLGALRRAARRARARRLVPPHSGGTCARIPASGRSRSACPTSRASPAVTVAFAALVQALVGAAEPGPPADRGVYAQNRWAALRFGPAGAARPSRGGDGSSAARELARRAGEPARRGRLAAPARSTRPRSSSNSAAARACTRSASRSSRASIEPWPSSPRRSR